jgi:hypothetical protein
MPLVHEMDEAPKGEGQAEGVEHLETGGGRRLASVTGQTLREHFHLPLHTVAQKFGMCTTAFKKMCRRLGIMKWPHRQVGCLLCTPLHAHAHLLVFCCVFPAASMGRTLLGPTASSRLAPFDRLC